jgi:hypothetical protein
MADPRDTLSGFTGKKAAPKRYAVAKPKSRKK